MARGRKPKTVPVTPEAPVAQVVQGKTVEFGLLIEWSKKSFKGANGDKYAAYRDALTDARNAVGALHRIIAAEEAKREFPNVAAHLLERIASKRGWTAITLNGKAIYTRNPVQA